MIGRDLLLIIHILLIVAWLGIDVGVFYSSFVMRRPGMSTETRKQVRSVMVTLDLAPRISLILMIPVGLGLAYMTGFGFTQSTGMDFALWALTAVALGWVWGTVHSFRRRQVDPGSRSVVIFDKLDWWLRITFAVLFILLGTVSLAGPGPFQPLWLSLKSLLFGLIIVAGLWIRIAARRYLPALRDLLENGESPGRLQAVNRAIRGVYPAVLSVWTSLVVMVALAVIRP